VLFAADDIQTQQANSFLCPAYYASMGFGVPGAIGAQLAEPLRRAIALVGDGAFQMTGMELLTAKRLGLNPIIIVINNSVFATIRIMGHQQANFLKIASLDYAKFAESLGGRGFVVETSAQLRQVLWEAHDSDTFSILDIHISPDDVSPALQRLSNVFVKALSRKSQ
jgi:indolepyruvate decarboxylase